MIRSLSQSLSTPLLAAADIGLGTMLHQHVAAPIGLLLTTVGFLVITAGLAERLVGTRAAVTGEFEHAALELRLACHRIDAHCRALFRSAPPRPKLRS